MKQMKQLFLGALLTCCFMSGVSQSAGYLGKRLILKTNVLNGRFVPFRNADLEFALSRRTTLNFSFDHFKYSLSSDGIGIPTGRIKPGNNRGTVREVTVLKNGTTVGNVVSIGVRQYFNRIVPAPYGYYISFSLGFGSATYSDYSASYLYKKTRGDYKLYPREDSPALSGKSKVIFFELPGFGRQYIFKEILVLDAKLALQGQYCDLPEELVSAMEHNYFVRSNAVNFSMGKVSLGLGAYIKLGLLLF